MKKFAVLVAVVVLAAFATPVLASTNPFMDVPLNHWAYDAIGQLAARGILSGFPDGLYRGKQPTTRYEMASALARAMAVVDMTKASKQDVEMLKKLVVEFKDELDALGVKVDQIDKRVAVLEDRLGGWKLSGVMRLDLQNYNHDGKDTNGKDYGNTGSSELSRARLYMDRWFGEDEGMHFQARYDYTTAGGFSVGRFYAEVPVWWDSKLTVGRFAWDMEANYYLGGVNDFSKIGWFAMDSWLTDRIVDGMGWSKSIGLGKVSAYVARPTVSTLADDEKGTLYANKLNFSAWELFLMAEMQFTEQIGFDLGAQAFLGDDSSYAYTTLSGTTFGLELDNLWTVFAGLRFNFNENIALRGMYYYQDSSINAWVPGMTRWVEVDMDSTSAFRVHLELKQDLLKFTSLWLEYNHLEQGFVVPTGEAALWGAMFGNDDVNKGTPAIIDTDLNVWRVAAQQEWNDKWTTFLYVAGHHYDNAVVRTGTNRMADIAATTWGLGAVYKYNPNVQMGLAFSMRDWDNDAEKYGNLRDDNIIRFRTQITF